MATLLELLFLAVALAMDCFTVSTVCGVILRCTRWATILRTAVFFGLFQALMPLIGVGVYLVLCLVYRGRRPLDSFRATALLRREDDLRSLSARGTPRV